MENKMCWSCSLQLLFQLIGLTEEYDEEKYARKFIKRLKEHGTIVNCTSCQTKVEYVFDEEENLWIEQVLT